ncbi:odorant receptor 30a-like [Cylas formicarius]|uniref:odorant receptor 30a-like n=1 Tax=Cylas formicarius TaxID=197179 RepID=UPI002958D682|nr:odorant receptor 30a-like [Cylas formicarius]
MANLPPQILRVSKYCMVVAGTWRLSLASRHEVLQKIYSLYSACARAYFPIMLTSMCLQTVREKSTKSTEEMFRILSYIILLFIVQIASLMCQTGKFQKVLVRVASEERSILNSCDWNLLRFHSRRAQFCRTFNLNILFSTSGAVVCIILENWFLRRSIDRHNVLYNESQDKPFAIGLYSHSLDRERHATLLVAINDLCLCMNTFAVVSTKIVFISCMIFAPSMLKKLQIEFSKLNHRDSDVVSCLKMLVVDHQEVVGFVETMNGSVKYLILLEYLLNSLNFAVVSLQFISFETKLLPSPILFFYTLLVQTFVLGWSANEIQVQSLAIADALYESLWYEYTERAKKMLLIMMMRAQKPLALTIGPFDAMKTGSALAIMKASYSYVTVMIDG